MAESATLRQHVVAHLGRLHGLFVTFVVLLALFGSALNAFFCFLALRERGDLGTQAMLITAWLNLAFPFATLCVLIHHATPGSVQRRAMFPKWFEVIFWLNSFGWFTFVLSQWRAEFGSFVHSVWWLAFFIP